MARDFDVLDLEIGDRGLEMRVPVDQPLAAIDQPLVVHIDEDLDHGVVEIALFAVGAPGAPDMVKALRDQSQEAPRRLSWSMMVPPDCLFHSQTFRKRVAAHFAPRRLPVVGQFALDHHLGGDAGVVLSRLPERVEPAHPVPADQDVLQRVVEGVAHMQRAGDVGRRDHDRKRFRPGLALAPAVKRRRLPMPRKAALRPRPR